MLLRCGDTNLTKPQSVRIQIDYIAGEPVERPVRLALGSG